MIKLIYRLKANYYFKRYKKLCKILNDEDILLDKYYSKLNKVCNKNYVKYIKYLIKGY